jgi:hypothetical protein
MDGSLSSDVQLEQAAMRRHTRVHASSAASTCPECRTETVMAAADLRVPNLWRALDDLWATVIRSRETKSPRLSPAPVNQVLPSDFYVRCTIPDAALRGSAPE